MCIPTPLAGDRRCHSAPRRARRHREIRRGDSAEVGDSTELRWDAHCLMKEVKVYSRSSARLSTRSHDVTRLLTNEYPERVKLVEETGETLL